MKSLFQFLSRARIEEQRPIGGLNSLGDRLKRYEETTEGPRLDVALPIYARIDGRSFSKFTRELGRDQIMSDAMINTMKGLVDKTHARIGYTHCAEISLVFLADSPGSNTIFNGRQQKMVSALAALATAIFTNAIPRSWAEYLPHFDCRVCQLPCKTEAANILHWRWKDATEYAIQMVALENFSSKQLHGKEIGEMINMLREKGVKFDSSPAFFRYGTFGRRVLELRDMTPDELVKIPEHRRPTGPVQRHKIETLEVEDFFGMPDSEAFIFNTATE